MASSSNLTLEEQVKEFFTTHGDQYLLPYLTRYEKLAVTQGKSANNRFFKRLQQETLLAQCLYCV